MMIRTRPRPLLVLLLLLSIAYDAPAQDNVPYTYVSPRPGAMLVPPGTTIAIRPGGEIAADAAALAPLIGVVGERSGRHEGRVTIARDGETIIFTPRIPFAPGETVRLSVQGDLRSGETLWSDPIDWTFTISTAARRPIAPSTMFGDEAGTLGAGVVARDEKEEAPRTSALTTFVPDDYPEYDIDLAGPTGEGYVFLSPFSWSGAGRPYLLILDNAGEPVYYQRLNASVLDFKVQPTGQLTYFYSGESGEYIVLDSAYRQIETWRMGNGYPTDGHELILLPNGNALMMSYDMQPVDMSAVVPGGNPDAMVIGLVIQEVDTDRNVVFEWRSWDDIPITDATRDIDLTAKEIDYVHGNAIEMDNDGNILISSRHLDEITKVDRQTAEIIWRWGGEKNEFTFIDDTLGFSHQHDIRRLPNGNIMLFDNGNLHTPPTSRAIEYRLDEVAKTATRVWSYPEGRGRYSFAMGNAQRLPNGNTMIGWGFPLAGARKKVATEVDADGTLAYEITLDTSMVSYRVFRFPWAGRSAAPYLWTEDRDLTRTDSVLLKMTMFGRDDVVRYRVHLWNFPNAEYLRDSTTGNTLVVDGLERGLSYLFRAEGVTASGAVTESSPWIRFTTLAIGPYLQPDTTTLVVPPTKVGENREYVGDKFLVNTGEEPLVITRLRITGEDSVEFRVSPSMPQPLTIQPGDSADLLLEFRPQEEGERNATLTIVSNAVNDTALRVRLTGLGATPVIEGDTVHFPSTAVGTTYDTLVDDAVCNTGLLPIIISELRMSSSGYILLNPPALPLSLDPGECLDLTIQFAPVIDTVVEGVLIVRSNGDPDSLSVILRGVGDTVSAVFLAGDEPSSTLRVRPLPFRDRAAIAATLPRPSAATIEIVDLEGRVVRRIDIDRINGTEIETEWDGRDQKGVLLPAGSYIVRVRAGEWEEEKVIVK